MLKQLPFKKEYLLVAASFLLLLICYELAFKKTIEAWQLNHNLKQQLSQSTDISALPGYQERKNNNLGKIIELYKADTTEFRSKVINDISVIAEKENVKLTEVPGRDPFYLAPFLIIQRLQFEGDYFSLIKTLKDLTSAGKIGAVRSIDFQFVNINQYSLNKKLEMTVFLGVVKQ